MVHIPSHVESVGLLDVAACIEPLLVACGNLSSDAGDDRDDHDTVAVAPGPIAGVAPVVPLDAAPLNPALPD